MIVDDDEDIDPFLAVAPNTIQLPSTAHIFDGPNAPLTAGDAQYVIDFNNNFGQLTETWKSVTVPSGGTVAFLHIHQPTDCLRVCSGIRTATGSTASGSRGRPFCR